MIKQTYLNKNYEMLAFISHFYANNCVGIHASIHPLLIFKRKQN